MHGIVMKITEQCIVVLCEDGKFRNIPHLPDMPQLGDRIPVTAAVEALPGRKHHATRRFRQAWWVVASILLLVGSVFLWNAFTGGGPSTLVAIDINPSIELYVERSGRVERVKLLNDDARKLISERELKGQDFYKAVHVIFDEAEEQGYLDAGKGKKWILLSTVDLKSAPFQLDKQKIGTTGNGYELEWFKADRKLMEKAEEAELTLNKYIVYEKAKGKGIELNIEDLRSHSIAAALTGAGVDPQHFFSGTAGSSETKPQADSPERKQEAGQAAHGKGKESTQPARDEKAVKNQPVNNVDKTENASRKPGSAEPDRKDPVQEMKQGNGLSNHKAPKASKVQTPSEGDKAAKNNVPGANKPEEPTPDKKKVQSAPKSEQAKEPDSKTPPENPKNKSRVQRFEDGSSEPKTEGRRD